MDAVIVATDENNHAAPTIMAAERGHALFIEKPLATDARESLAILTAIENAGMDAVLGYTQRFRRRFLAVKERLVTGQIGDVHSVVTRAFMNRMVPIATVRRTQDRRHLTPMVVSGTHSLDMSLWLMEGKSPRTVYARSTDKVLSSWGTKNSTFGIFTMDDGAIFSMNICWALPEVWPGSVYGLEIGIVGTEGVIDIEDTHRDLVMATSVAQGGGYVPDGYHPPSAARRLPHLLPSRRPAPGAALGADARGDGELVPAALHGSADAARHGAGRPPQPRADHGDGPVGPARQPRWRCRWTRTS